MEFNDIAKSVCQAVFDRFVAGGYYISASDNKWIDIYVEQYDLNVYLGVDDDYILIVVKKSKDNILVSIHYDKRSKESNKNLDLIGVSHILDQLVLLNKMDIV